MTLVSLFFPSLLALHILAGVVALSSGVVAMASRKTAGGTHARAGNYYWVSMSAMALSAALLTAWEPDRLSLGVAIWTFYLVQTSRQAAVARNGVTGWADRWTLAVGLLAVLMLLHGATVAAVSPDGAFQGMGVQAFLIFGLVASLSVAFDLSLIWRGALKSRQRIARHLWRMVTAYLLAATSLFLGQQDDVFPFMNGSPVLLLPSLLTLAILIYWILRVRFARNWLGRKPTGRTPEGQTTLAKEPT